MMPPEYTHLEDEELIGLLAEGKEGAFSEIYERYWEVLVKTAFNILKDRDASHDCVQDVFLSLWKNRGKSEIRSLSRYLFRATKLKVFEKLRNGKISQRHLDKMTFVMSTNNIEEYINDQDIRSQLENSLAKLPAKCRKVFELSRFEYLTNKEIAARMQISLKTVEGHMTKALRQLQADFGQFAPLFFICFVNH